MWINISQIDSYSLIYRSLIKNLNISITNDLIG